MPRPLIARNLLFAKRWFPDDVIIPPMLEFKSFSNARRVLIGIEFVKIFEGQDCIPAKFGSSVSSIWRQVLAA